MKRLPLSLLVFSLFVGASIARADLHSDIQSLLSDKVLARGESGVQVVRLSEKGPSTVVFEFKPEIPRIPASNLKLITTSAVLDKLGPDFKFRTTLAGRGADLALIGDGDPTMGDAELLKKLGWSPDTLFKTWAEMLRQRNITTIENLYIDDSIFDEKFTHPNWPTDQLHKRYEAQMGGLNFNGNCIDFYVMTTRPGETVNYRIDPFTDYAKIANTCITGDSNAIWLSRKLGTNEIILRGQTDVSIDAPASVTIHDPSMFAGTVFAETLARNGVKVTGKVIRDRTIRGSIAAQASAPPTTAPASRWTPVAVHSTPLATVLARTNKDSNNLYAESLCKRVGAAVHAESGSWDNGLLVVGQMLLDLGIPEGEFNLDDGCGLSRKNVISPRAMVRVLEHEFQGKNREAFRQSLAIGAVDGTLEDRFRNTDLKGRVFGKSGYISGVRSLSGYLNARDGQWYAFSILMNSISDAATAKVLQERIVRAVDMSVGAELSRSQ